MPPRLWERNVFLSFYSPREASRTDLIAKTLAFSLLTSSMAGSLLCKARGSSVGAFSFVFVARLTFSGRDIHTPRDFKKFSLNEACEMFTF